MLVHPEVTPAKGVCCRSFPLRSSSSGVNEALGACICTGLVRNGEKALSCGGGKGIRSMQGSFLQEGNGDEFLLSDCKRHWMRMRDLKGRKVS